MTIHNPGMSKRSLLLLGGLTAAVTNPTSRRKLLDAVSSASGSVQALYQETVKPLAQQAQQQLQEGVLEVSALTQELAQMAAERGSELAQVAAERGSVLVQVASERGSELAHAAAERGAEYAQVAAERGSDIAQVAAKRGSELTQVATERGSDLAQVAAKRGSELASQAAEAAAGVAALAAARGGQQVQGLLSSAQGTLQDVRTDGGRVVGQKVRQGRKQALKLQKELSHEVSVRSRGLEKLSGKKLKRAEKELAELKKRSLKVQKNVRKNATQTLRGVGGEPAQSGSPMTGVLIATGLLVGGGVLLARVPAVRHSILKAVGSVSPEAAEALHAAGTSVRDIVGSVWLERIEPETATAAPAPKPSQATGSAAYASVEPGSPAQEAPPKTPEDKPTEGNAKN
ncbi:hypothetical protein Q0M94_00360 [Deinococcus radiomollis]|uniref:hypothetical protein n=1 Tax=Deinococcus radiomollis TaxID=468916 RepID=UPI0038924301